MTLFLQRAGKVAASVVAVAMLVLGFLAYFVSSQRDRSTWFDGLGRELHPAPIGVQVFLGRDPVWPGWGWALVDAVVALGGVAFCAALLSLPKRGRTGVPLEAKHSPAALRP